MGKPSRIGIGFDLEKAIETLHREAMAAGAVPSAKSADSVEPEISAQAHLHGIGPARCANSPCRLAGLCLALTELVQYRAEVRGLKPLLDALALTEDANIWLAKSGYEYAKALNAWIEHSKERHEWERACGLRIPMHAVWSRRRPHWRQPPPAQGGRLCSFRRKDHGLPGTQSPCKACRWS